MTGSCLAFNPCRDCTHKEMCSICELTYFKSGTITPQSFPEETISLSVGDVLYVARKTGVKEYPIERIGLDKNGVTYAVNWHGCGYELFFAHDIGKTVFLTREDAQKHLEDSQ